MSRLPLFLVCVALASCKETKLMQAQLAELNVKIQAVQTEMVQMENQMADYRKQMPTAMSGGQVAKQQAAVLAAGLAAVENGDRPDPGGHQGYGERHRGREERPGNTPNQRSTLNFNPAPDS